MIRIIYLPVDIQVKRNRDWFLANLHSGSRIVLLIIIIFSFIGYACKLFNDLKEAIPKLLEAIQT